MTRLLIVGILLLAAMAAPVRAQEAGKSVSLAQHDTSIRNVLEAIFDQAGGLYAIEPNVPDVLIDLRLHEIPLPEALYAVVRLGRIEEPRLSIVRENEVYVVKLVEDPPALVEPPHKPAIFGHVHDPRIGAAFEETPLRTMLRLLFRGADISIGVAANVPDPRFSLQIDPLFAGDALHRIVRVARRHAPGLRVSFEGNVYYVTHAPLPEAVEMRLEVGETTLTARTASGGSVGVTALDGDRRVAAVLAPRVLPDGRIEIAVEVVVGSGDAAQRLKSLTVVPAGVPREIGRVTVAGQDVPVRLRVSPLSAEE